MSSINFSGLGSLDDGETAKPQKCKGLFYRYSESTYYSSHGSIEQRQSFRLLKKRSCPGCDECAAMLEFLVEDIGLGVDVRSKPVAGDVFRLCIESFCYWTDYGNDYDCEIYLLKVEE